MPERQGQSNPTPGDYQPLSQGEIRLRNRIFSQDLPGIPSEFLAWISKSQEMTPPQFLVGDLSGIKGEEWREIGATGQPTFTAGWANAGGSYGTAAFYRDALGIVHLKGRVTKSGGTPTAGDVIFTLPGGYVPAIDQDFAVITGLGNDVGQVDVQSDGDVVWQFGQTGETDFTSLNNISFRGA